MVATKLQPEVLVEVVVIIYSHLHFVVVVDRLVLEHVQQESYSGSM